MSDFSAATTNKPKTTSRIILIGVTQIRIETLQRFGLNIVEALIDNQDAANNITVRKVPSGVLATIPPNSLGRIRDEVFSFIEVNPDAATGAGVLTLSLATSAELKRVGLIA